MEVSSANEATVAYSARACADELRTALERNDWDAVAAVSELDRAMRRLVLVDGLDLIVGAPKQTVHSIGAHWLYWDGEINILLARFESGVTVTPHDHGTAQMVGAYRGTLDYQLYRRADDGSSPSFTKLELVEDRKLQPGDFSLVPPPPHDIHGFTPRDGDMLMLVAVFGTYSGKRLYFDSDAESATELLEGEWKKTVGR
jgi:hypothetical protein